MSSVPGIDAWLKKLKEGDKVLIRRKEFTVGVVVRLTKTQLIVLENGRVELRYRIRDGRRVGESGFYYSVLFPYSEAALIEQEKRNAEKALRRKYYDIRDLPIEALQEIDSIVQKHRNAIREGYARKALEETK